MGTELSSSTALFVCKPPGDYGAATRFRWVKAPNSEELTQLAHVIAQRVGRFLERQGLLERDVENSYLVGDAIDEGPMDQLLGHSITYRIAVGPQAGRKVFTLQTLPSSDPDDQFGGTIGSVQVEESVTVVSALVDELNLTNSFPGISHYKNMNSVFQLESDCMLE